MTTHLFLTTKLVLNLSLVGGGTFARGGGIPPFPPPLYETLHWACVFPLQLDVLSGIQHKNIVRFFGAIYEPPINYGLVLGK